MTRLEEQVAELVADGWKVVNRGRVLVPYVEKYPKPSFSERVEGFHGAGSGDRLLDDDEQWVQLHKSAA